MCSLSRMGGERLSVSGEAIPLAGGRRQCAALQQARIPFAGHLLQRLACALAAWCRQPVADLQRAAEPVATPPGNRPVVDYSQEAEQAGGCMRGNLANSSPVSDTQDARSRILREYAVWGLL